MLAGRAVVASRRISVQLRAGLARALAVVRAPAHAHSDSPPRGARAAGGVAAGAAELHRANACGGAIPVHLFAGIWGTIAVIFSNSDATLSAQLYGIFAIGAFTIVASTVVWYIIKFTIGVRVTPEEEMEGMDLSEIGMEAYPDFRK